MREFRFLTLLLLSAALQAITSKAESAHALLLPNEEPVFTFRTEEGKVVLVANDTNDTYLIVRLINRDTLELEYPSRDTASWNRFTYTYFFRPDDGESNGLDLNYLDFTAQGFRYILYDIRFEAEEGHRVGLKKTSTTASEEHDFKAVAGSVKGDLSVFRQSELIHVNIGQLFD